MSYFEKNFYLHQCETPNCFRSIKSRCPKYYKYGRQIECSKYYCKKHLKQHKIKYGHFCCTII